MRLNPYDLKSYHLLEAISHLKLSATASCAGLLQSLRSGNASIEQNAAARRYLHREFGVVDFYVCEPWAVLGCSPSVPEGRLPQSIGGLISIWRRADDMEFWPVIGQWGQIDEDREVDPSLLVGFERGRIPPNEAIARIATHLFTDCEAITLIVDCLIVELPATEQSIFVQRLANLPSGIAGAHFHLLYHNGPLPNSQRRRRAQRPKPEVDEDERIADETDYVAKDGKFYPGAMISSLDKHGNTYCSVSAGVLVRKGSRHRLTCSWHCWEEHEKTNAMHTIP